MIQYYLYKIGHVATDGTKLDEEFTLPEDCKTVTGILIYSDNPLMPFRRGQFGLRLDGMEILPDEMPAFSIMSGSNVQPDERYLSLDTGKVSKAKLSYQDQDNALAPHQAYDVYVIFRYKNA